MPLGYSSLEAEDKLKLANYEFTISPSQLKTEQTQEQFFLSVSKPCLNVAYVFPKSKFEQNENINETMPIKNYQYKLLVL